MRIGISACLAGKRVRYDGQGKRNELIMDLLKGHEIFLICPEVAGGLPVPRHPSERIGDRVINQQNEDVTLQYMRGSEETLSFVREKKVDMLILKTRSPACGKGFIYDGTFSHVLSDGNGTFAEMCLEEGIPVYTEEETEEIKRFLRRNQ